MRTLLFFLVMLPMFVGYIVATICYCIVSWFEGAAWFWRIMKERHERD